MPDFAGKPSRGKFPPSRDRTVVTSLQLGLNTGPLFMEISPGPVINHKRLHQERTPHLNSILIDGKDSACLKSAIVFNTVEAYCLIRQAGGN